MYRTSLGAINLVNPTVDISKIATKVSTPTPPAPKVSWIDKLLNAGTKVTDFGNKAADTAGKISTLVNPYLPTAGSNPAASGYTYNAPGTDPNAPKPEDKGMSTGAKVAIGVAAAAAIGGLIYAATKGKKSMNGPAPAKKKLRKSKRK